MFKLGTENQIGLSYRPKMALFRPWVPYITVYIFAQFRPVRRPLENEYRRGYKTVHCLGAKEKMWTRCPLVPEN